MNADEAMAASENSYEAYTAKSEWAYEDWAMSTPVSSESPIILLVFDELIIELFGLDWANWEIAVKLLSPECIDAINKRMREGPVWASDLEKSPVYIVRTRKLNAA